MEQRHIHYVVCPQCNAPTVRFSVEHGFGAICIHQNGELYERIEFLCGRVDQYVPNFQRIETLRKCSKSPEQVTLKNNREQAAKRILEFVKSLEVDREFKEKIEREVEFARKGIL